MMAKAILAGLMLATTAMVAEAACGPGMPAPGNIEVCVLEGLAFGTVTEPAFGSGIVTVTPAGDRFGSFGVDEVASRGGGFHAAEILVKGEANQEFELSFSADGSGLSDFTTDTGTTTTLDGNGERLVRIGATFTITGAAADPSNSFSVTATLAP